MEVSFLREVVEIFYFVEKGISEHEREWVRNAVLYAGFDYDEKGVLKIPKDFFASWRNQYNA